MLNVCASAVDSNKAEVIEEGNVRISKSPNLYGEHMMYPVTPKA